jgi:hypothetical protein
MTDSSSAQNTARLFKLFKLYCGIAQMTKPWPLTAETSVQSPKVKLFVDEVPLDQVCVCVLRFILHIITPELPHNNIFHSKNLAIPVIKQ